MRAGPWERREARPECLSVPFVCASESPVSRASPGPVSERTFQITCAACPSLVPSRPVSAP